MSAEPLLPWLLSIALFSVRVTVAMGLSPALSSYGVPAMVRVALCVTLSALTFAGRVPPGDASAWAADPAALVVPLVAEVFVGMLMGFGVHIVLAGIALAGRLMDVQVGFAIGSVFDPVTRGASNVLGAMMGLLGVTLFFGSDAHLELVRLLIASIDLLPLGHFPQFDEPSRLLIAAGSMFTLALGLAAPVTMALVVTDFCVGVASRNLPQVNVLMLVLPIKVIVSYTVLSLAIVGWSPLVRQASERLTGMLGGL
jgi:flagellar biosynthesis protein FliR